MILARSSRSTTAHLWRVRLRAALAAAAAGLASIAALAGAPVADASEASTIVERCARTETLQPLLGFSPQAYATALRTLSTVAREYSPCEELIRKAELLSAAGSGGGGGSASGGPGTSAGLAVAPPTAAEQATLARAPSEGGAPVSLGTDTVNPGVVKVGIASAFSSLPDSLIALLALLLALLLASLWRAVLTRRAGWRLGGLRDRQLRAGRR